MFDGPLKGVRVLALENAIAGPYGSMIMADLGAEVIKIEPPEGELSRSFAGPKKAGESFYFLSFNKNKKSIVLDLMTPSGKRAFFDLVKISDVVWNNFRPGVMERLGLGYETLKKINPTIIYCSVSGYGSSGPYMHKPSYEIIVQGISGMLSVTGEPGRPPVRPGVPIADMAASLFGVIGVLSALHRRNIRGEGEKVEVALLDICVSLMTYLISYYFCSGDIPSPQGTGHRGVAPYGVFRAKDGYVALGLSWPRIADAIGAPWLKDDPRFKEVEERVKNQEELKRIIEEHLSKKEVSYWVKVFEEHDVAGGPVNNVKETCEDPQVLHRKMILSLKKDSEEIKVVGNPVKMEGIDDSEFTPPPSLGEHTSYVLKELLGYSDEDIERMRGEMESRKEERIKHTRRQI